MQLITMLDSTVRKFPRKDALVYGDEHLSYEQLQAASRRAAHVLRDVGVKPGDRVAVMTFNTPAFVIAAFGIWRAGAVLVPINHKLQVPEVKYLIEHSGVALGIVDATLGETARAAASKLRWLVTEVDPASKSKDDFDSLVAAAKEWDGADIDENDIAELLYTSGTTASPKGCLHTHRGLTTVAAYTTATVGLQRDDRFLIAMPIWHSSPLNNWFLSMIFLGGTVVLQREYHPIDFLKVIEREKVSAFFGAPIAYLAPLQVTKAQGIDFTSFDLSSVRVWTTGGAPIGADTMRLIKTSYRSDNFYQVYGMTEMGPVGTTLYPAELEAKAGAIGHAGMPGVDVRVVGDDGKDASPGETGEIWLRSDTRMQGYLNNPDATAGAFVGDWFRSGDVARLDEDGYLFIVDRLNDIIITGGENVYSQEVEEALRPFPGIADVAVIGEPNQEWGESIVVAVVLAPAGEGEKAPDVSIEDIRSFLEPRLAHYKIPRKLIVRDSLPRNPSGKLTKHVLRAELGFTEGSSAK